MYNTLQKFLKVQNLLNQKEDVSYLLKEDEEVCVVFREVISVINKIHDEDLLKSEEFDLALTTIVGCFEFIEKNK